MLRRLMCYLIHSLLCRLYRGEYLEYVKLEDIEKVQRKKLMTILEQNQDSEFGKTFGFRQIRDIKEYQTRVPLTDYNDYTEAVEQISLGKNNVLTSEPVQLLEPTSGSNTASKLIPYTQGLKHDFQKGLKPWVYDLYTRVPGLKWGQSYWSVTPAAAAQALTSGGIPIGFEEDSAYLGGLEKKLLDYVFAVPGSVAKAESIEAFYFETSVHLLLCKNLTFISVWNPTYLMLLLEYMTEHSAKLTDRISEKDMKRGRETRDNLVARAYHLIWKHLKVISCWCDSNASPYAERLQEWFPEVLIQPKGLLATEGFISIPFLNERGARLSVHSHFFEFQSTKNDHILLAHELEEGERYKVIITTSGGLYRYQLNDIIQVVGFSGAFPRLVFMGRSDRVSDLFGEKLHEQFVEEAVKTLGIQPDFYMLAPETDHYVFYVKANQIPENLAFQLDRQLRQNFHYDYCRKLGQLKPLQVYRLTGDCQKEYLEECVKRGQRLGDIKPVTLHLQGSWDLVFKGAYQ